MSTEEKSTVEIEKPPAWAISLSEKVNTGFQAVNARLTGIETNQEIQGDTVRDLAKRMTAQEERANKQDDRLANASMRAKEPSSHDLETSAALAAEIAARTALAAKVDSIATDMTDNTTATLAIKKKVVDGVESFWKRNPKLETALVALVLALIGVAYQALTHGGVR